MAEKNYLHNNGRPPPLPHAAPHTGHPFDTIKVLMQMQPDKYGSAVAATRDTIKQHGLSGLYRGVGAPLIGNGFYNAVQFAVFSRVKHIATDGGRNTDLSRIAAAGAFTGIFVALVEGVSAPSCGPTNGLPSGVCLFVCCARTYEHA